MGIDPRTCGVDIPTGLEGPAPAVSGLLLLDAITFNARSLVREGLMHVVELSKHHSISSLFFCCSLPWW